MRGILFQPILAASFGRATFNTEMGRAPLLKGNWQLLRLQKANMLSIGSLVKIVKALWRPNMANTLRVLEKLPSRWKGVAGSARMRNFRWSHQRHGQFDQNGRGKSDSGCRQHLFRWNPDQRWNDCCRSEQCSWNRVRECDDSSILQINPRVSITNLIQVNNSGKVDNFGAVQVSEVSRGPSAALTASGGATTRNRIQFNCLPEAGSTGILI